MDRVKEILLIVTNQVVEPLQQEYFCEIIYMCKKIRQSLAFN